MNKKNNAFTLVEILVSIAIISVLISIILVVYMNTRKKTDESVCISNLRQLGIAIKMYQSDYDELPYDISNLYPKYVTSKTIFRCPVWDKLCRQQKEQTCKNIFSLYIYVPSDMRFGETRERQPGDPEWLHTSWQALVDKKGDSAPLMLCTYHNIIPLSDQVKTGKVQSATLILRSGGSVEKRISKKIGGGYENM